MKNTNTWSVIIAMIIIVGISGGTVYLLQNKDDSATETSLSSQNGEQGLATNFEARNEDGNMVLYRIISDGTLRKTGLEVTLNKAGSYEVPVKVAISPDETRVVFNQWHDSIPVNQVFISNIDGTDIRLLTQQEVPEGRGELIVDSLAWSNDGEYVTYSERQTACKTDCGTPADFTTNEVKYLVNVTTGEKEIVSTSQVIE
jgi:hypothetical protein